MATTIVRKVERLQEGDVIYKMEENHSSFLESLNSKEDDDDFTDDEQQRVIDLYHYYLE